MDDAFLEIHIQLQHIVQFVISVPVHYHTKAGVPGSTFVNASL